MKTISAVVFALLLAVSTFGATAPLVKGKAPLTIVTPRIKGLSDTDLLRADRLRARPLSLDVAKRLAELVIPGVLDYSGSVTLTRCQDGCGGCPGMTMMHIADILSEWEHPYTPDRSWYAYDVMWSDWMTYHAKAGYTWDNFPNDGAIPFEKYGVGSEGLCHSNYDLKTPKYADADTNMYPKGDMIGWVERPSPAAIAEAKLYRMRLSTPIALNSQIPDPVGLIKQLLFEYGPISAGGWWRQINNSPKEGHCMTLVGYNDNTKMFTYLNSWGDWWSRGGAPPSYGCIPYSDILKDNIDTLRYPEIIPSDRSGTPDAYSARIRIHHGWRGELNVRIGVEGRPLMLVWDTRGRRPDRMREYSGDLCIDVPLPDYAASCWPPSPQHRWVLQVEDVDRNDVSGAITEWTLARLKANPNCKTMGYFTTETYGGARNVSIPKPTTGPEWTIDHYDFKPPVEPNPNPGVIKIYLPDKPSAGPPTVKPLRPGQPGASAALPQTIYHITMGKAGIGAAFNPYAMLSKTTPVAQQSVPVGGATVGLYELEQNACVNKPSTWILRSSGKTDSEGKCAFSFVPPIKGKHIYAAAYRHGTTILASSEAVVYQSGVAGVKPAKPGVDLVFPDLRIPRPIDNKTKVSPQWNTKN